jgi:Predicted transcriptional regulator
MSSSSTKQRNDAVLEAVRQRLEEDPTSVLPTLRLLIDPDALADPLDESTVKLAKTLNAYRVVASLRELRERAYSTAEVAEMLGGISRQAVSQRVAKGQLMSIQISGKAWFPDWQFENGLPIDGLPQVIAALREMDVGTWGADALARNPIPEENGRTLADILAVGDVDRAVHYAYALGGGF